MKKNHVKKITRIAALAAIAFVLQLIVIPPKVGGFLDIEFSDLPALIAAFAMGPLSGVCVELIKNLLHLSVTSTGFVGELANFVYNGIFVLVAGIIYKYNRTRQGALIAMLAGVVVMTISAIGTNLFIMFPLFLPPAVPFAERLSMALAIATPFNLCRGIVLSLITYFSYKKIKPLLV